MSKKSLDELLEGFASARKKLEEANAEVHSARLNFENSRAAFERVKAEQKKARTTVRQLGEQLQEALPGYLAGATTERTVG